MPYKEKEIEKLYYTIGEVAQLFGVNTSHIRFWSNEFDVIRPATNKKGNRLYTREDINNFQKIYHLVKEKGYTLRGAKTELRDNKNKPAEQEQVHHEVDTLVAELPLMETTPSLGPIDQASAIPAMNQLFSEDYVDRVAIRNSLEKVRNTLLEIKKDINTMIHS